MHTSNDSRFRAPPPVAQIFFALLTMSVLAVPYSNAVAANRIFGLHLKNGLSQPVTFKIKMESCYQGTGWDAPDRLSHGPVQPGQSIKIDLARVQGHGCDGKAGHFEVIPVGPDLTGEAQGFSFDNAGTLWMRQLANSFNSKLSSKSTQDETYTFTISRLAPGARLTNGAIVHLRNAASTKHLTQTYGGSRDDKRNVGVWSLPSGRDESFDSFRWLLQEAGGGYWKLVNLRTGLVLTWDGNDQNVSNWGEISWGETSPQNPSQLWRFVPCHKFYMIVNKKAQQGLTQAYGGTHSDKNDVALWPGQNCDNKGWSWLLEDAGSADLLQLTLVEVKAIKTSTGQDAGTAILFDSIEAAISGGSSAAKDIAKESVKITTKEVIKKVSKEAAKEGLKTATVHGLAYAGGIDPELADAALDPEGAAEGFAQDQAKEVARDAGGDVGALAADAMDTFDAVDEATSLQGLFNLVYGDSHDDLDIRVSGVSIWPNGGRDYREIDSQQTMQVDTRYLFERSKGVAIQLVEYDYGSNDDWLGSIAFTADELREPLWLEGALIREDSEGSLYELTFSIGPVGMSPQEIRRVIEQKAAATERAQQEAERQAALRAQQEADRQAALRAEQEADRAQREAERQAALRAQQEAERQAALRAQQEAAMNLSGEWVSTYTCPSGQNVLNLPLYLSVDHQGQSITAVTSIADKCLEAGTLAWEGSLNGSTGNLQCGQFYDTGTGTYAIRYVPETIQALNTNTLIACTLTFTRMSGEQVAQRQQQASQQLVTLATGQGEIVADGSRQETAFEVLGRNGQATLIRMNANNMPVEISMNQSGEGNLSPCDGGNCPCRILEDTESYVTGSCRNLAYPEYGEMRFTLWSGAQVDQRRVAQKQEAERQAAYRAQQEAERQAALRAEQEADRAQREAERQAAYRAQQGAAATPAYYYQLFFPGDQVNSYYVTADWQVVRITPQGQSYVAGHVTQSPNADLSLIINWSDGSMSGVGHQGAIWSWDASGTASQVGDASRL